MCLVSSIEEGRVSRARHPTMDKGNNIKRMIKNGLAFSSNMGELYSFPAEPTDRATFAQNFTKAKISNIRVSSDSSHPVYRFLPTCQKKLTSQKISLHSLTGVEYGAIIDIPSSAIIRRHSLS